MLTREENEILTGVGRGTPGGEMLRRYWMPVAVSAELSGFPDPLIDGDGRPVGDVEGWAARRTELLGLFERHVYGYRPPDPRSAPAPTVA